jgi:hypothetical protein
MLRERGRPALHWEYLMQISNHEAVVVAHNIPQDGTQLISIRLLWYFEFIAFLHVCLDLGMARCSFAESALSPNCVKWSASFWTSILALNMCSNTPRSLVRVQEQLPAVITEVLDNLTALVVTIARKSTLWPSPGLIYQHDGA